MKKILITTGNGMFGKALAAELLQHDVHTRIMVRDISKCTLHHPNAEIVTGNMDDPATLEPVMEGIDSVFLSAPIDDKIALREHNVIEAAKRKNVSHIVKIFGAVKHEGDRLVAEHQAAFDHLKNSGIPFTLISPNSVMETSLNPMAASIRFMHALYGISEKGKIGMVALNDITKATAVVLTTSGHEGRNYELTGPVSLDMDGVASCFTDVLGKTIQYIDLPEERFSKMIMKFDKTMTPERMELEVLCHLRAWREGKADLVTDTFHVLTGNEPTSLIDFIKHNKETFTKGMVPGYFAWMMRKTI